MQPTSRRVAAMPHQPFHTVLWNNKTPAYGDEIVKMNYVVLGTNDMPAAVGFYDALFEQSGLNRVQPTDRMTYWLNDDFAFAVALPFDGKAATHGNGAMIGFSVGSNKEVERLHELAIALGGTCEGAPGQRGPRFSAYARDPDGNKLCFSD